MSVSVTQRIKEIKQPRGGYIKLKKIASLGEGIEFLHPKENVHATIVGLSVDYLTRFMTGTSVEEAFRISLKGANIIDETKVADKLIKGVIGLDDVSITNAVKLSGFDVCFRAGVRGYKPVQEINPDSKTIENIRIMVERSLYFFEKYGPKVLDGFNFIGGYTNIISSGDGDFVTEDTLWDFKVSSTSLNKDHTLQLLIYWRMGLRSINKEKFMNIQYLGVYNPRKNEIYRIDVSEISEEVIREIDVDIIGYDENDLI